MSFSQFIRILLARRLLGLAVLGVVVMAVALTSMFQPRLYTATAAVLVDSRVPHLDGSGSESAGNLPGYMATQIDVAQSHRVTLGAVKAMGLSKDLRTTALWRTATEGRGNYQAWLAELVKDNFKVVPSRESGVMALSYTSTDPHFAAAMTNALLQAYIEATLELRIEPARQYAAFFDARVKQLREDLEQAQSSLSLYQRQSGLIAANERVDIENARLAELSSQIVVLQALAADASGRQVEAGANPGRMQEVLNNVLVSNLASELSKNEVRLKELMANLGGNHPQALEAKAAVDEAQRRLNDAINMASGSVGVASNVARSRLTQATQALEAQRLKVLELSSKRDEAALLQRDVESARLAYDTALTRRSQTDMESQNRQTNVSILQRATEPPFPSSPRVGVNLAVAFIAGTMLAMLVVLLKEFSDRRIRMTEDLTVGLKQRVLIRLPNSKLIGSDRRRWKSPILPWARTTANPKVFR